MEWNELLGLSPSLLGGGTASGNNQLPPGPGQIPGSHDKRIIMVLLGSPPLYWQKGAMPAFTGSRCNASVVKCRSLSLQV